MNLSILISNPTADDLQNIESFFKKMPLRYEIISTAKGIAQGVRQATGEYVFMVESKLPVPLAELIAFMTQFYIDPKTQIIVGDRLTRKNGQPLKSSKMNGLARRLFSIDAKDVFCPLKAFRNDAAQKIFQNLRTQISNDVEIFIQAQRFDLKVQSLPVFSIRIEARPQPIKMFFELVGLWFFANRWSKG